MAEKNFIITSTVAANSQDIVEHPMAIPSGKLWVIRKFGAADINLGDSKSTVYVLRFGTEILRIISVTGNTYEPDFRFELTGDGSSKINVVRQNKSGFEKICPFWVSAFSKD